MRRGISETHLEAIARDSAVRADCVPNRMTTHARLGESLRRLYGPVQDDRPDQIGHLLMVLEGRLSGRE
jgi:hypothetical protein